MLDCGPVPAASGTAPVEQVTAVPLLMTVVETSTSAFGQVDLGAAPWVVCSVVASKPTVTSP